MTEITRSVTISASPEKVWAQIHPKNWTKLFDFVKEVYGYTDGKAGVGTQAKVVAGDADTPLIQYNVEITEFIENQKIGYRRYGGPLTGEAVILLRPAPMGTLMERISYYEDDLSQDTIKTISAGIEKDNEKIKTLVEDAR
ncbi:MAG TPA: SRPBCC family protein [bacterium]